MWLKKGAAEDSGIRRERRGKWGMEEEEGRQLQRTGVPRLRQDVVKKRAESDSEEAG